MVGHRYSTNPSPLTISLRYPSTVLPLPSPLDYNIHESRLQKRVDELEEELKKERAERARVQAELEKAVTHAVCVGWEVKLLQERLNRKTQGKKRKVQVTAHYVTSADAARILKEREQAEEEKRKQEEAAQAIKKAKDEKRKQQREAGGSKFSGSIASKNRDDLLDITHALKLTGSDSNVSETKAELVSMINTHLDNNPQLAADETFSGLFLSRERARKRNAADENFAPPPPNPNPPPQLPPQPPLSADLKPSGELPMVLINEMPDPVNFFHSTNPPVSFTPYLAPPTNDVYPYAFAPIHQPHPPSQHPHFFHPPFGSCNSYFTPSASQ